ncbi:MAG: ArnT family glycosyltransferase [Polyangiales bacterium]
MLWEEVGKWCWRRQRPALLGFVLLGLGTSALGAWNWARQTEGWAVRWSVHGLGGRTLVTESAEPVVDLPNCYRAMSRYSQGWPFERLPLPPEAPTLDASLRTHLMVPPGGRRLHLHSPNTWRLWVDGQPYTGAVLRSGVHQVRLRWWGADLRQDACGLHLRWQAPGGWWQPVPRAALARPQAPSAKWYWLGMGVGWLLAAAVAYSLRAGPRRQQRLRLVAMGLVGLVGLGLRLVDYSIMPHFFENGDELFAAWNGFQLLTHGRTLGWSLWAHRYAEAVQQGTLGYFGQAWALISPYFEHPPLMHLLAGAAAKLGGASHFHACKLQHTRLVAILLSSVSIYLVWRIAEVATGRFAVALVAGALQAILPLSVLQGRVVKEESLLTVLMLASTLAWLRWRAEPSQRRFLWSAMGWAALTPPTKITGLAFVLALCLLASRHLGWRDLGRAALLACSGFVALLLFGAAIDPAAWLEATQLQASIRASHWNLFPRFFHVALINENLVGRGWLLFLWVGYLWALGRKLLRTEALVWPPLLYLVALAFGTGNWTFGWYMLPIWPFLIVGAATSLVALWQRPTPWLGLSLVVLLVFYGCNFLAPLDSFRATRQFAAHQRLIRGVFVLLYAPLFAASLWPRRLWLGLARLSMVLSALVFVYTSVHFVLHYELLRDSHADFDREAFFDR